MVRVRRGISLLALGVTVLGTPLLVPSGVGKAAQATSISRSIANPMSRASTLADTQPSQGVPMLAAPPDTNWNVSSPLLSFQTESGEVQPSFHLNNSQDFSQEFQPAHTGKGLRATDTQESTQEIPLNQGLDPVNVQALQPLQPTGVENSLAATPDLQSDKLTQGDNTQAFQSGGPGNAQNQDTIQDQQPTPSSDIQTQQPTPPGDIQAQQPSATEATQPSTDTSGSQDLTQPTPLSQTSNQDSLQAQGLPQLSNNSDTSVGIAGSFSASLSCQWDTDTNGATASNNKAKSVAATLMIDNSNSSSSYQVSIDWGDGTIVKQAIAQDLANKSFQISGKHTYQEAGTYQATLTLFDNSGNQISTARTMVIPA